MLLQSAQLHPSALPLFQRKLGGTAHARKLQGCGRLGLKNKDRSPYPLRPLLPNLTEDKYRKEVLKHYSVLVKSSRTPLLCQPRNNAASSKETPLGILRAFAPGLYLLCSAALKDNLCSMVEHSLDHCHKPWEKVELPEAIVAQHALGLTARPCATMNSHAD